VKLKIVTLGAAALLLAAPAFAQTSTPPGGSTAGPKSADPADAGAAQTGAAPATSKSQHSTRVTRQRTGAAAASTPPPGSGGNTSKGFDTARSAGARANPDRSGASDGAGSRNN